MVRQPGPPRDKPKPKPRPMVTRVAEKDIRALLAVAEDHQDCGPPGEGWKSDELKKLIERVANALAIQTRARERQTMEECEARIQTKIDLEIQMEGD